VQGVCVGEVWHELCNYICWKKGNTDLCLSEQVGASVLREN